MSYEQHLPATSLRTHIQCYWSMRSTGFRAPQLHQILPDGCMDVIFDLQSGDAQFVGTMTSALEIMLEGPLDLLSVRFNPGGAFAFFGTDAKELTDEAVSAQDLLGPWVGQLCDGLMGLPSMKARLQFLDSTILGRFARLSFQDTRFLQFIS